jgi:hypothetical protein
MSDRPPWLRRIIHDNAVPKPIKIVVAAEYRRIEEEAAKAAEEAKARLQAQIERVRSLADRWDGSSSLDLWYSFNLLEWIKANFPACGGLPLDRKPDSPLLAAPASPSAGNTQ